MTTTHIDHDRMQELRDEEFNDRCEEFEAEAREAFFADEFKIAEAKDNDMSMEQLWHISGKDWLERFGQE